MMFGTETAGKGSLRDVRIVSTGSMRIKYQVLAAGVNMPPA
jgi:hypothetical protein